MLRRRETPRSQTGAAAPETSPVQSGIFRKEGEFWTVAIGAQAIRLKDSKGLAFLGYLLRHPQTEFHVLDLIGGIENRGSEDDTLVTLSGLGRSDEDLEKGGMHVGGLGDAGEQLDDQAKREYRSRLSELREELEEAKAQGKAERAEQIEDEIETLTKELSRAVGLGGRNRRAASASERARQSITKTIKSVVERIAESDAALAEFFSRCIKTGNFCSYRPDPDSPIAWEFGGAGVEPQDSAISDGASASPSDERVPTPIAGSAPFRVAERTPFVEREGESTLIRAAVDAKLKGRGSIVVMCGGPGIGKTRLAMEAAGYAQRNGFRYLVGRCYESTTLPYLPFVEMIESYIAQSPSLEDCRRHMGDNLTELAQIVPSLRRVFSDLPEPLELPPEQKQRYLFQNVSAALAGVARQRPYLLILEDLHWADESTLALVSHLADFAQNLPLLIIATYRDGFLDQNPALLLLLEQLIRSGIRPLKLGGFSRDGVAKMLTGLSRREVPENLVDAIFAESDGNPFFVEEVYRHLLEDGKIFDSARQFRADIKVDELDVPDSVRLILSRRLAHLSDDETKVLIAAAVIGRSFSFQLLEAIIQADLDELFTVIDKAQKMGLIVSSSEGPEKPFAFAHELVRQTLLAQISDARRQQLHARVADAIERLAPESSAERAGEIADHLVKARSFADKQKLLRWLALAGNLALEGAAFEEALRSFEVALSYCSSSSVREKVELLTNLATAERGLERRDAELGHLREALDLSLGLGERELIALKFTELTDALIWAGRFREARDTALRGLRCLEGDASADRVNLFAALSQAYAVAGAFEPSYQALREAVELATRISDQKLEARVIGTRCIVNFHFFRLLESIEDGLQSEKLAGAQSPPWQRALRLRILLQALIYSGQLNEADKILEEVEALAKRIGEPYSTALCQMLRAWREFGAKPDLFKLEAAQSAAKYSGKAYFPLWLTGSEINLSMLNFFRGNWAEALLHAKEASSRSRELASSLEGWSVGFLFRQLAYAGDREEALRILSEARSKLPETGRPNTRGAWLFLALVIEGLALLGEREQAARLYPLACELIQTGAVFLWTICRSSQSIAGIAATAAAQYQAAEAHFEKALEQATALPHQLEHADILRFYSLMLLDRSEQGDREKARTLLGEALQTYSRVGMPRHVELTRTVLARAAG